MNLGQTMLSIAALAMLSLITLRYYGSVGQSGQNINLSQTGLTATTIATSYIERAQSLDFDEATSRADSISADSIVNNPNLLTAPGSLGRETGESAIDDFDDFDDYNGWTENISPANSGETYRATFSVCYVQPTDIETNAGARTFVKRMDIKVWRTNPPLDPNSSTSFDTARVSTVFGYFKFH